MALAWKEEVNRADFGYCKIENHCIIGFAGEIEAYRVHHLADGNLGLWRCWTKPMLGEEEGAVAVRREVEDIKQAAEDDLAKWGELLAKMGGPRENPKTAFVLNAVVCEHSMRSEPVAVFTSRELATKVASQLLTRSHTSELHLDPAKVKR